MAIEADMRCDQVVEMVSDYLERALDARDAEALEQHLLICSGCAEYVEQIRAIVAQARRLDASEPVPDHTSANTTPEQQLLDTFRRWKARKP